MTLDSIGRAPGAWRLYVASAPRRGPDVKDGGVQVEGDPSASRVVHRAHAAADITSGRPPGAPDTATWTPPGSTESLTGDLERVCQREKAPARTERTAQATAAGCRVVHVYRLAPRCSARLSGDACPVVPHAGAWSARKAASLTAARRSRRGGEEAPGWWRPPVSGAR
jgi:hypothetical protein